MDSVPVAGRIREEGCIREGRIEKTVTETEKGTDFAPKLMR